MITLSSATIKNTVNYNSTTYDLRIDTNMYSVSDKQPDRTHPPQQLHHPEGDCSSSSSSGLERLQLEARDKCVDNIEEFGISTTLLANENKNCETMTWSLQEGKGWPTALTNNRTPSETLQTEVEQNYEAVACTYFHRKSTT